MQIYFFGDFSNTDDIISSKIMGQPVFADHEQNKKEKRQENGVRNFIIDCFLDREIKTEGDKLL